MKSKCKKLRKKFSTCSFKIRYLKLKIMVGTDWFGMGQKMDWLSFSYPNQYITKTYRNLA